MQSKFQKIAVSNDQSTFNHILGPEKSSISFGNYSELKKMLQNSPLVDNLHKVITSRNIVRQQKMKSGMKK